MKRTIWTPTLAWLAAASVALVLAVAAPSETLVMGQLPSIAVKRIDQTRVVVPGGLSGERTLALVAYTRSQREEIASWVKGLQLDSDSRIAWIHMPVINDPGDESMRVAIENAMLEPHAAPRERTRLVPVFTNREAFVRAAGISSSDHASVLVLDRQGKVLGRAEGRYDEAKAQALRETLFSRSD